MIMPTVTAFVSQAHFLSVLVVSAEPESHVTVYRQYDKDIEIVRGGKDVPMRNDEQLFIDYEVPQGVPISYWVVATIGGESFESKHVLTPPYDFGRDVLFDLGDPKRGMLVWVEQFGQYKYGISRDVQRVWGRRDPVVISGVREMFTSKLDLLTLNLPDRENLLEIIKNGSTVAMSVQSPKYGLDGVLYFAVGDVEENRLEGAVAGEPLRRWSFDIQQISPPPAEYRYPAYGKTWRELREFEWKDIADQQWWEAVAA
jgi:hypothetical protein